jgi:hypothetical protein
MLQPERHWENNFRRMIQAPFMSGPPALEQRLNYGQTQEKIDQKIIASVVKSWSIRPSAAGITKAVFDKRGVASAQLPPASATGDLLPPDEAAEAKRANSVQQNFGSGRYLT